VNRMVAITVVVLPTGLTATRKSIGQCRVVPVRHINASCLV
jgi:hypothetical protein